MFQGDEINYYIKCLLNFLKMLEYLILYNIFYMRIAAYLISYLKYKHFIHTYIGIFDINFMIISAYAQFYLI